jgi:hypothetical protein
VLPRMALYLVSSINVSDKDHDGDRVPAISIQYRYFRNGCNLTRSWCTTEITSGAHFQQRVNDIRDSLSLNPLDFALVLLIRASQLEP